MLGSALLHCLTLIFTKSHLSGHTVLTSTQWAASGALA